MFKTLTSWIPSRAPPSRPEPLDGYQPITSGVDDEEAVGSALQPLAEPNSHLHGRGVYWCFVALGAGILLPWNALICTYPLLSSFFPADSPWRNNLSSYLGTVYCFSNLFFMGVAQRNVASTRPTTRLQWSLLLMLATNLLLAFLFIPLILPALSSAGSVLLMPLLTIVALVLSVSGSFLQSAVFALAALWGPDEIFAVMSGQGAIAVVVSGAQLLFAIVDANRPSAADGGMLSTLPSVALWTLGAFGTVGCLIALRRLTEHPGYVSVLAPLAHRREEGSANGSKSSKVSLAVFRKNLRVEFAVAFVFMVTLAIFPPITVTILSVGDYINPGIFISLHFLIFNVADWVGRTYVPAINGATALRTGTLVLMSLARVAFFPLVLWCNTPARRDAGLTVLPDFVYWVVLFAFGVTNGGISTICMIVAAAPALNPAINDDEKDIAGTLASFSLVSGLALGSLCSFAVNYVVNGNPLG